MQPINFRRVHQDIRNQLETDYPAFHIVLRNGCRLTFITVDKDINQETVQISNNDGEVSYLEISEITLIEVPS